MRYVLILFLFLGLGSAQGQSLDELQRQMRQHEAEIARINKLLDANKREQDRYIQNRQLTTQKIANRRKIIGNLDKQIQQLALRLGTEGTRTVKLSEERNRLRNSYSELIRIAYLHDRQTSIFSLLASDNKLLRSSRYVQSSARLSEQLKERIYAIDTLQRSVEGQIAALTSQQKKLADVVAQRGKEIRQLEQEERNLQKLTADLKSKNSELNKQASRSQQELESLQQRISQMVKEESKAAQGETVDWVLSSNFEQNAGRLPSPLENGVVVAKFGMQNHPTQSGIKIENTGVNIACSAGSPVHSIFEGEIRAVFPVASMGNSILIRHGKYLTVYSGLGEINVKKGDKVKTGEKLGTIDAEIKQLHFEVWKETTVLDPEKWIRF